MSGVVQQNPPPPFRFKAHPVCHKAGLCLHSQIVSLLNERTGTAEKKPILLTLQGGSSLD